MSRYAHAWNLQGAHFADTLPDALTTAATLATGGGAVTIDLRRTAAGTEHYRLRLANAPALDGWTPRYTVQAHDDDTQ